MKLKDKIAIIAGAGTGSGRAGALLFSKEGAKVVVGDTDLENGKETVNMVEYQGGEAVFVQIDPGKVDDIRKLIDSTVDAYGKIDILWNLAGMPGPGLLEDTEEAEYIRSWEVNCKGGFFAAKFAVPHMKKAGGGSIVFTGSIAGLRGSPISVSYSSFKGAVVSLTWALALHLGPQNIRVNCICPGLVESPFGRLFFGPSNAPGAETWGKAMQDFGQKSPMGRIAKPVDIANAALFLASDEAAYVNGVILPVDGGTIVRF